MIPWFLTDEIFHIKTHNSYSLIMTHSTENGNLAANDFAISPEKSSQKIQFQIYPGTDSRKQSKDEVKAICNRLRGEAKHGKQPFVLKSGVEALKEMLDAGQSVHFGITYKSCKSNDAEGFWGCFADYDAFNSDGTIKLNAANITQILSIPEVKKYGMLFQFSHKGKPNLHLFFRYSRRVSFDEHSVILKAVTKILNNALGIDKQGFDHSIETNSSNLCFAGKTPCQLIPRGEDEPIYGEPLDVDSLLMVAKDLEKEARQQNLFESNNSETPKNNPEKPVTKVKAEVVPPSENINTDSLKEDLTNRVLKHIVSHCQFKNFEDYYNLIDHKWQCKRGNDTRCGNNPFSNNHSGESFTITHNDPELPPNAYDRANGEAFNLITYFRRVKKTQGEYVNIGLKGNSFKKVVNDICNHFSIPNFEFDTNKKNDDGDEDNRSKREKLQAKLSKKGFNIRLNEMSSEIFIDDEKVNHDTIAFAMDVEHGIVATKEQIDDILIYEGSKNKFHPVRDYLKECITKYPDYDKSVLEGLGKRFFGSTKPIHDTYTRKMMLSAVTRVMNPGCNCKMMLTLSGGQDARKSDFIKALFGAEFTNTSFKVSDRTDKDDLMQINQFWAHELAEVDKITSKVYRGALKDTLSNTQDSYRLPYGRRIEKHPRASIFIATTNEDEILSDPTGNVRFWMVPVTKTIPIAEIEKDRDKFWAMAYHAVLAGESFYLTEKESKERDESNEEFEIYDALEDLIIPKAEAMAINFKTCELMQGLDLDVTNKALQMRISAILKKAGWVKTQKLVNGARPYFWNHPNINPNPQHEKDSEDLAKF
jgi:predicted P-loop ATPase